MSNLTKSKNKSLFGVCGGIAEWLNLDVSVVRILFVIGAIFTGSIVFWLYLLLALILPNEE
ncbi:PspC domain-containing protein [bacterium]|nr:PspC domain-containing protein [bacterium]